MKKIFVIIFCFQASIATQAQSFFSNTIVGSNPSMLNPFAVGQIANVNITAIGIGRGTGVNPAVGNDRYNASGWTISAGIDTSDYFSLIIGANPGYEIDYLNFTITTQRSSTGPPNVVIRSSADSFTSDIITLSIPTSATLQTVSLAGNLFQHRTAPTEFRIYGFGASGSTGTFSINDFDFRGIVHVTASLPVKFSVLTVEEYEGDVIIRFTNSIEADVVHYQIERSSEGSNFKTIGVLKARGNMGEEEHYIFRDGEPLLSNVYRIRAREMDGSEIFSSLLQLRLTLTDNDMVAFPNPVRGEAVQIRLKGLNPGAFRLELVDMSGAVVRMREVIHPGGAGYYSLPVVGLKRGRYLARVREKAGYWCWISIY